MRILLTPHFLRLLCASVCLSQAIILPQQAQAQDAPVQGQFTIEEVPSETATPPDSNQLQDPATQGQVPNPQNVGPVPQVIAQSSPPSETAATAPIITAPPPAPAPVPVLEQGDDYQFGETPAPNAAAAPSNQASILPDEFDVGLDALFDTESIAPKKDKPRPPPKDVDPAQEPASKLIIVEDVTPSTDKSSKLVAAERAMALGRYDSALAMYDAMYKKNKRDSAVLMGRAVCLQKLERFDEAMEAYQQLADLQPKNVEVKVNMLGLLATRYPSVALRRLMDLHEQNQDHVGIVSQIAVTAGNLGDYNTALQYLGIAMGIQPQNASHIFNAAVIMDRAGNTKEAVDYYEKALEVDAVYGGNRSVPREVIYERLAHIR